MNANLLLRARSLVGVTIIMTAVGLSAAPLEWFPAPSLFFPLSQAAAVSYPGLGNVVIGGDGWYQYPEVLNATNQNWGVTPMPLWGTYIAPGAVYSGGAIILYGGTDGSNSQSTAIAYSTSDTATALPSMSVARSFLGYAPDASGNAYAIGGLDAIGNPLASAESFSQDANVWTPVASLPAARYNFPAVFDGKNRIYIFGGRTNASAGTEIASVLYYSVQANTWTPVASMPIPAAGSAAALGNDGKIYVAGGVSGGVTTDAVQVYDPSADSWAVSTPLPEPLSQSALGMDSTGRLIVIGGIDANGNDVSDVWRSQQLGVLDTVPVFTSYPASNAVYSAQYSSSVNATGNPQPVYLLISGPTNMTVDCYSGAITWTPQGLTQVGGAVPVTIRTTNYAGTADLNFSITVPNPKPVLPTNFYEASATEYSATIAWSPVDPIYGPVTYNLYIPHPYHSPRGSGGGVTYQFIGSTTTTNITITGLKPNTSYPYSLSVTGPGGTAAYAGVAVTTLGPQPPANLRATAITSTSLTLAWDPPPGPVPIVRYEIDGWVGGQFPTIGYGTNFTGTTATITGLTPTYEEWAVRGYDAAGNVSGWGGGIYVVIPAPAAANFSSAASTLGLAPGGGFQFSASLGGSLQTVVIEATTNPADPTSWEQIGSLLPTNSTFTFTDPNAGLYPNRFYRILTP